MKVRHLKACRTLNISLFLLFIVIHPPDSSTKRKCDTQNMDVKPLDMLHIWIVKYHPSQTTPTYKTMTKAAVKKTSQQEDWHPADVVAELRKAGLSLAGLAKAYGLNSSSAFSVALVRSYPICEQRIADALGIHPMIIWPSRYNADGTIKPRGYRDIQFNAAARVLKGKQTAPSGRLRKVA